MQEKITVLTCSRRFEGYKKLIEQLESQIPDIIQNYLVLVDDETVKSYKHLSSLNKKIKVIYANKNYIHNAGWNCAYNLLASGAKTNLVWLLFDTDDVNINVEQFKKDLMLNADIYGYPTYMVRGDSQEIKTQLYNKTKLYQFGALHENLLPINKNEKLNIQEINSIKVTHNNAIDEASKNLKKTSDGFIILEIETDENSDGFKRNRLYESLVWKIVHGEMEHLHIEWFKKHYNYNKSAVDYYHTKAEEFYNNKQQQ